MAETREESINEVISSIAMEELALSHIINAEGEKLQYALGTLSGSGPVPPATLAEIISLNNSINATLKSAAENQIILKNKLEAALSSAVLTGPTGATGPAGTDGVDGADGAAAAIAVGTVTELPYGQPPTVINSGTESAAVLDFGLPAGAPPTIRVYRANLSATTSEPLVITLGPLNYDLRHYRTDELQLYFRPATGYTQAVCDFRIVSQYNETSVLTTYFNAIQGNGVSFSSTSAAVDVEIYGNTQETHQTWLRVQSPTNPALWSTYEIKMFCSSGGARVIVWVMVIDENGSY